MKVRVKAGTYTSEVERTLKCKSENRDPYTVSSKTVAMFEGLGPIAMQRLTAWKSHLAFVRWNKVLLLGFPTVLYS